MATEQIETVVNVSTSTQILAVIVAVVFMGVILELIRRHKLQERYTVVWFIAAMALLVLALVPELLGTLASLVGVTDTNVLLLTLAILTAGSLILNLTVTVSRQSEQITRLAQEVAILRSDYEERKGESE